MEQSTAKQCNKRCHLTRQDAKNEKRMLNRNAGHKKEITNVYYCDICKSWHLTSMDKNKSRNINRNNQQMNAITPQIKNDLRLIATRLPTVMNQTQEFHYLTGRELKEMDIEKDEEGNPLIDDVRYKRSFPVLIASNHYRNLKKAFKSGGEQEVIKYIRKVKSMPAA